jgi:hypothetical protein
MSSENSLKLIITEIADELNQLKEKYNNSEELKNLEILVAEIIG